MNVEEIQREDDLLITADVARAVEEQELVAYYQPAISLADGRLANLEALVRWTMPDGTVVPAALFVPSLDRTDTIFGLDWFMAEDVCGFLDGTGRGTAAFVPTRINISARHATDPDFAKKLEATVGWHDIDKDMLRIELSEAVVAEPAEQMRALVSSLQESGFTVVVDNLASGPDALDSLKELGITEVKVAGAYWKTLAADELAALVQTASDLGIDLGAEGVESEDELELVREAGFSSAQGYHIGEPTDGASLLKRWAE